MSRNLASLLLKKLGLYAAWEMPPAILYLSPDEAIEASGGLFLSAISYTYIVRANLLTNLFAAGFSMVYV